MALTLARTGTSDSIDADYLSQGQVRMHLDAVDGIARDVMETPSDVGGLLLGHVRPGERPTVWIDRYQRVVDDEHHRALEEAAESISRDGELAVVGFYRSHARPGLQADAADRELADRYFSDPVDILLLIHPDRMMGRFLMGNTPGPTFPFRGRAAITDEVQPDTARTLPPERGRRIVPDFTPLPELKERPVENESASPTSGFARKWRPLIAAMALVGAAVGFVLFPRPERHEMAPVTSSPVRPLGLYADPTGDNWRVSWNPQASALKDAREVRLFVRDGDDQNRIDLTPQDLQSGTYQYQPKGLDVTFRLEVTDANGRLSAESFRFEKSPPPPIVKPAPAEVHTPRAIHRVPPVVPASIRPRIHGSIPIDVRVSIDDRGRVTSATALGKHTAGLLVYLAGRAVVAAKQWRFEPGGAGSETIHFVFDK